MYFFPQGINRTLLSWIKLWDETVFGHSSLSTNSANVGRAASTAKEKRGGGSRGGQHGSEGVRAGGKGGRGGLHGKSEWREFGDPVTFASEEVCSPVFVSFYCII